MECWGSKADEGLFLCFGLSLSDKIDLIPPNPILQYSITPDHSLAAEPIYSDLAQRTRFSMLE